LTRIFPGSVLESLQKASILVKSDGHDSYRSTIRVSSFYLPNIPSGDADTDLLYYIHSSFPTSSDSVFFGPDTYLYLELLRSTTRHLDRKPNTIVDICCGAGAGAIHLARTYPDANTYGLDLNPQALKLGGVNAMVAGTHIQFKESDLYKEVEAELGAGSIDLIVSNPPYIASSADGEDLPVYADGGAQSGLDISIRIVEEGARLLKTGGCIILYTGVAITNAKPGHDPLLAKIRAMADTELVEYTVLHPDMWPEEIGKGAYAEVGRIQAVGAVLKKR
jgi:methylase of polypeptide subunit release factors